MRFAAMLVWLLAAATLQASDYFRIHVVDAETGRGIPLVELKTVHAVRYYTDSNGLIAFNEPGLMDQTVYFHVRSHGYEYPADGFGNRGVRLDVRPGGKATIEMRRVNIAERLYRITGAGIYRDTMLLGETPPTKEPVLNGQVLGSDSAMNALFNGKIYWFWGDTNRPSYPLGNFHTPGATSLRPEDGGLDPDLGVDLDYFVDQSGFAKETCRMPGPGPTWLDAVIVLTDDQGRQRMFGKYSKIKPPLEVYEIGLVEFDTEEEEFKKRVELPLDAPLLPGGEAFIHEVDGRPYVYFSKALPVVRVPANVAALEDLTQYEAFTCLVRSEGSEEPLIDRDDRGRPRFAWRRQGLEWTVEREDRMLERGEINSDDALFRLRDAQSNSNVRIHRGSVAWNPYRQCWVLIATELFGSSALGEVWYSEASRPEGPWGKAMKIVSHDKYSFYNPRQHPMLAKDNGRVIFFEGTYTTLFSGNEHPTPRYEYNQIMYRLQLDDPRLQPAH